MRVLIVAGSRTITNTRLVEGILDRGPKPDAVVSGLAKGPDQIGLRWAESHGIHVFRMGALWNEFGMGNRAGFARNVHMAQVGTELIAFHDGLSRGTLHMIAVASEYGLTVNIHRIDKEDWA